jgi:lysophospholipase L1-like esterase
MRRILLILLMFAQPCAAATYFAELGKTRVKRVIVVSDTDAVNGEVFCNTLLGGKWKQTFIDGSQRARYAGPGYWYDPIANQFKTTISLSMIGDSIIANMAATQSGLPAPFTSAQNLGVSGNTVAQIQARIGTISAGADHIVIEAGTNDLVGLGDGSNIIPGYTAMLNSLAGTRQVIVAGIPNVDEAQLDITHPGWKPFLNNALIASYNTQLVTLCNSYANCSPATALMAMNMTGKTSDGIHPLSTAYTEFCALLLLAF